MKNKLLDYKQEDGTLMSCVFPGGYPVYYYNERQDVFCAACATEYMDEILGGTIYYAGPDIECEICGEMIESAYGEDSRNESID